MVQRAREKGGFIYRAGTVLFAGLVHPCWLKGPVIREWLIGKNPAGSGSLI